jgi:hypothetical protein
MEFAAGIRVYMKGLCHPQDFGLEAIDFFMLSSQKEGAMVI